MPSKPKSKNRYVEIIEHVFRAHHRKGLNAFEFERSEIEKVATALKIELPKNLGDLIYSFRYRIDLPATITSTAPKGKEWIIASAGKARYRFKLATISRIAPRPDLITTKIPDATPEVVVAYAQGDEQALLAKLRYNRLIDVFLGLTTYSLQNHLRTTVAGMGQIEIDELYVGIDKFGAHHVIPVQAKGGSDKLGPNQTAQDIAFCIEIFPNMRCRAISAQFMDNNRIALFELTIESDEIKIVDERHYLLVPNDEITAADLLDYRQRSN
jgi:hypothetical protein